MAFRILCILALCLFVSRQATAASAASPPVKLTGLPNKCPYNYTVVKGDTYCIISTKTGITIASLMHANPKIPLNKVSPGERFKIPCKPETDCCPDYIIAAANGTGLGSILAARPDLTLTKLVAANKGNAKNVNATHVKCGAEIKVPCYKGSPTCKGIGYPLAPKKAPTSAPTNTPAAASKNTTVLG